MPDTENELSGQALFETEGEVPWAEMRQLAAALREVAVKLGETCMDAIEASDPATRLFDRFPEYQCA